MTSRSDSRQFPVFEKAATELVDRLREHSAEEAMKLADRGRRLVDTFSRWSTQRPTDEERVRSIQELLDFSREAHECLARLSSSRPPPP